MSAAAKSVDLIHPGTPERVLGDDGGRAYRRFLAWTVGDGFAMAVIEVRSPAQRRDLLAWTAAEMPGTRVVALDQASGKPLWPLLEQACPSPGGPDILVLTRLEEAADRITLCARLNIQRDELAKAFPVPWVVLVHPAAALELQQHAPDFSDFAGLWLNEEREESALRAEVFSPLGLESRSALVPTMALAENDAAQGLLAKAYDAIALSRYDEAVDLLAQHDMSHPDAREHDPQRIRLAGLLLWRRGQPAQAISRFEEALARDGVADKWLHASLLGDVARVRAERGEVDVALDLHREQLNIFEALEDRRSRAITLGDIARLRAQKGEVDAALILHNEALQVYEELDDRRSRAITLGDIARLRAQKGEVDTALVLHNEALQVYEELDDRRSRAITLGDIARLRAQKGEVDAALILHNEALQVYAELGDRRSRAVALGGIARLRADKGEVDAALVLHREALQLYEELGDRGSRAVALGDIARLRAQKGEVDAALILHNEALQVYEELGDRRSRAVALGDIALARADKGELDAALVLHSEELQVYEQLGDRGSRAITLGDIARLRARKGECDAALVLHHEALKVYEDLGDPTGIANARWSMGLIAAGRGDHKVALDHLSASYAICEKIGRLDAICAVGIALARLLIATDHKMEATPILERSRDGFARLGRPDIAQQVQGLIDAADDDS